MLKCDCGENCSVCNCGKAENGIFFGGREEKVCNECLADLSIASLELNESLAVRIN